MGKPRNQRQYTYCIIDSSGWPICFDERAPVYWNKKVANADAKRIGLKKDQSGGYTVVRAFIKLSMSEDDPT